MAITATKIQSERFIKERKPGSGRKPGSISVRTKFIRAVSNEAIQAGVIPLEVMLDNMRFYHEKAQELLQKFLDDVERKKLKENHVEALLKLYEYRDKSQKCAVDAAPYVHSRLSSVTVTGEITQRHELPEGVMLEKAMELYRDSLRGRASAQMKTIEHSAPKDEEP